MVSNAHIYGGSSVPASHNPLSLTTYHQCVFKVPSGYQADGLRWYRAVTTGPGPNRLVLQDASGAVLRTVTPLGGTTVGWHYSAFGTPIGLNADEIYSSSCEMPSGMEQASNGGVLPTADSPITALGVYYANAALPATITGTYAANEGGVCDVSVSDLQAGTPGPGATTADVSSGLADWLRDDNDNLHKSGSSIPGLPWTTKAAVDAAAADTATTKVLAQGATGFDAIKAVADAIASAVGGIPGTIATAVTTITGQVTSSAATVMGTGLHTIGDIYGHTTDLLSHLADLVAGNAGGTSGALSGRSGFPTVLWTLADERDWTGQLAWAVPADLYVLSITDANGAPPTVVDGVNWYPRLGWWAPLTSTLVGDRRFFEFDACRLEDGGRRMAGVLLKANDGLVTGHIQAWVLT